MNVSEVRDSVISELKGFLDSPPRVSKIRIDDDSLVISGDDRVISTGCVPLCGSISEYIDGYLKEHYEDKLWSEWVHLHYDYKYTITMKNLRGMEVIDWLKENASLSEDAIKWLWNNVDRLCGAWIKVVRLNYKTNEVAYYDKVIVRRLSHKPSRLYKILGYTTFALAISSGLSALSTAIMGWWFGLRGLFTAIGFGAMLLLLFTTLWLCDDCPDKWIDQY